MARDEDDAERALYAALERLRKLRETLKPLAKLDQGKSSRRAYMEHGMLCLELRGKGDCECGYSEILAALCYIEAEVLPLW